MTHAVSILFGIVMTHAFQKGKACHQNTLVTKLPVSEQKASFIRNKSKIEEATDPTNSLLS